MMPARQMQRKRRPLAHPQATMTARQMQPKRQPLAPAIWRRPVSTKAGHLAQPVVDARHLNHDGVVGSRVPDPLRGDCLWRPTHSVLHQQIVESEAGSTARTPEF
mmetsp:Transcript_43619/g.115228  ORF Transcript_43619/g.115228 Transcript_43619/m.115228 type:complete len:105 (+) Transcript_43619:948-1262(+)